MQLNLTVISGFLKEVLLEDIGICGDITTNALFLEKKLVNFEIASRETMKLCGEKIARWYLDQYNVKDYESKFKDGDLIEGGDIIIHGKADVKTILLLERTILNFMQHLSGVATITSDYVKEIQNTKAKITDTRKTIPGLRAFQKYAVRCGGGVNHRLALDSAIMLKDNHINAVGSVSEAVRLAKLVKPHYSKIIVECDNFKQFEEALSNDVEIILLDNMDVSTIEKCVSFNNKRAIIEASGGITIKNVRKIAETGVDFIAVGAITHSVKAVDIGLDLL